MKKLLYIALLLTAFISLYSKGLAQGAPPFRLQEVDGSPSVLSPTVIKVTNGTMSCTGKTCTITTGGGGGAPGGAAGTVQWNDTGAFNGTSGLTATATTVTIVSGVSATFSRAGLLYTGTVTTDNASVQTMLIQGDRATVASNDEAYITYRLSNAAGTQTEVARQTWAIPTTTAASENGRIDWSVMTGGALAKELQLSGADLSPSTSDGLALGTTSLQWSDLFLASGAVLDFANGNVVLTHSSGILTMGTGELRITTVGTNTASVPTLGSVSTLSNKTLATGTAFAGYSDIATIAAPANPSAGNIRLYADSGTGNLTCLTSAGGNCLPSGGSGITIGTTTITSGTATRLLYETAGNVVGEISGATSDGTTVTLTSPTVNTGITLNAAPLTMSGNISSPAWTTSGIRIKGVAATLTDTTSSGTVAAAYTNVLGGNTIAASSSTTFTDYYTTFITQPTAGTNVTFTRRWALGLSGNLSAAGTIVQTSASATAFESGPNGSTNPVFRLVNNTASADTGFSVTGVAAGTAGGPIIRAISSGSNSDLSIFQKGSGNVYIGVSTTNGIVISPSGALSTQGGGVVVNSLSGWNIASSGIIQVGSQGDFQWASSSGNWSGSKDLGFNRLAAGVMRITNASTGAGNLLIGTSAGAIGTSGAGVLAFTLSTAPSTSPTDTVQLYSNDAATGAHELYARNEAGEVERQTGLAARNSSSFAKTSDTTLANITGLTRNVEASRTYAFTAVLQSTAAATGGVKFSVSGTATATAISYEGILMDGAAVVAQTRATALDTTVCASTTSTAGTCTIRGVIAVSGAGTLTIQFAQNASDGGASTVLANQYFQLIPIS